ncbi:MULTISPECIES: plastocyanin/azurin family copper-binding protein [Sphingobacterium]|uniref:plastocyanin/azurin family copper-binding protein n=1 Tax=Sphingobacterium TaxID=28453 RepID=UPI0013DA70F4|nr:MULTISPECIES: azurin [unclassified Sphingobacterium]
MKKTILTVATLALLFTACNNATKNEETATQESTPTESTESTESATPADAGSIATVAISGGDDMKFDKTEILVKEGQTVKLTLTHSGKAPVTGMGHNFVLLAAGTDATKFAAEAVAAKDNDYIPASMQSDVIAHTKTIGGGETTEIEFVAPPKGTYTFLCSFPGHAAIMKGNFIVE